MSSIELYLGLKLDNIVSILLLLSTTAHPNQMNSGIIRSRIQLGSASSALYPRSSGIFTRDSPLHFSPHGTRAESPPSHSRGNSLGTLGSCNLPEIRLNIFSVEGVGGNQYNAWQEITENFYSKKFYKFVI